MKLVIIIVVALLAGVGTTAGLILTGTITVPFYNVPRPKMKPVLPLTEQEFRALKKLSLVNVGFNTSLTPAAKPASPAGGPTVEAQARPAASAKAPETAADKTSAPANPAGAEAVAAVWDSVETDPLLKIAEGFSDAELAPILVLMKPKKVAELMAKFPPDRAAKITRAVKAESERTAVTKS